ncbi:MAG: SBBP repeat-containing protein [Candidatus Nanopelagicales bacterium]
MSTNRQLTLGTATAVLITAMGIWSSPAQAAVTTNPFGGSTGLQPVGIALDAEGNIYTANNGSNTVTRISADGTTTAQFGGTTGAEPYGIAVDTKGNVYTANSDADTVTRISADGTTTAQFGGTTGSGPGGIAVDADGNVYTGNTGSNTVTRISADGTTTAQFGGTTGDYPVRIALDTKGNVYTANNGSNSVTKISADGATTTQFGGTTGDYPNGIAVDAQGNAYVANVGSDTVTRISADGTTTAQFGGTTGHLPDGIAVDAQGNVYTVNYGSDSVTKISADGTTTAQFGGTTGTSPGWLALDADGNVFTANYGANSVTRISPDRGPVTFNSGAFPAGQVGSATRLTVKVTNTGEGSVRPTAITAIGSGVTVTGGTCVVGTRIAPDGTCTVSLSWTPSAAGPLSNASLMITYPGGTGTGEAVELTGTATPKPDTVLKVTGTPQATRLPLGERSVLVKKVRSDGQITRTKAWCELDGRRLPQRIQKKLCGTTVTSPDTASMQSTAVAKKRVRITATPSCNTRLTIHATITAKKPGAIRTTWTRTWRPQPTPRVVCRITGTG